MIANHGLLSTYQVKMGDGQIITIIASLIYGFGV